MKLNTEAIKDWTTTQNSLLKLSLTMAVAIQHWFTFRAEQQLCLQMRIFPINDWATMTAVKGKTNLH